MVDKELRKNYEEVEEFYSKMVNAKCSKTKAHYLFQIKIKILAHKELEEYFEITDHRLYAKRVIKLKQLNEIEYISVSINNDNELVDNINYETPSCAGLYFIGETHFNPFTKEEFYWVKIGKASNLKKRMTSYNTCNPMCYRIDYKPNAENLEPLYQSYLKVIAVAKCNHNKEWFLVTRETYLEMCELGFDYFNKTKFSWVFSKISS